MLTTVFPELQELCWVLLIGWESGYKLELLQGIPFLCRSNSKRSDFMDREKIEQDILAKWKTELEAEKKKIMANYEKLEEKVIQAEVKHNIYSKMTLFEEQAKEAYNNLEAANQEKKTYDEKVDQRLKETENLILIIDSEQ